MTSTACINQTSKLRSERSDVHVRATFAKQFTTLYHAVDVATDDVVGELQPVARDQTSSGDAELLCAVRGLV